jgi:hypothetical protein
MLAIRATMEILPADPRARKLVGISESFNDNRALGIIYPCFFRMKSYFIREKRARDVIPTTARAR